MVSTTTSSAYGDSSVFEGYYRQAIPTTVDANLCEYCRRLAVDVLAGPSASSASWMLIRAKPSSFPLCYLKEHHDGTLGRLLQSGNDDCELCTVMAQEILKLRKNGDLSQRYCIFVRLQPPMKCEFQLGLGAVSKFLEDIGSWHIYPISFTFFRRNGSDTNWSILDKQLDPGNGFWPPFSVLPNQFPDSEEAVQRVRRWLSECTKEHKSCARFQHVLPKRVLDLGPPESFGVVNLYVTKGEVAPYLTLSYSWGLSLPLKTTSFNIDEHCAGIPLEVLPKTLKDAIFIARRLHFRYLWIDALCIIQGDETDWVEQAAAMTEIYQGSTLTISATCSHDCDSGIFTKLPDYGFRIGTYFHPNDSNDHGDIYVGRPNTILDLAAKHLSSRGWVSQERLVSVASLHYTDEGMVWECADGIIPEHNQNYRGFGWKYGWRLLLESSPLKPNDRLHKTEQSCSWEDHYDFWNRWIGEYSEQNLTHIADKLPAVAGIAKYLANKFQITYAAGLWKENIISGLLWQRYHRTKTLVRYRQYVAPSWSWASVQGLLKYHSIIISPSNTDTNLVVLAIEIEEDQPGKFGRVRNGKIFAEGLIQDVVLDERKPPYQKCGIVEGVDPTFKFACMLDEHIEPANAHYRCWCLRVGTYNSAGRQSAVFLLLKKVHTHENRFCRIGMAEIDAWDYDTTYYDTYILKKTDYFLSGQWLKFELI